MDVGFNARLFGVNQVEMFDEETTILVNLKTRRNRFLYSTPVLRGDAMGLYVICSNYSQIVVEKINGSLFPNNAIIFSRPRKKEEIEYLLLR